MSDSTNIVRQYWRRSPAAISTESGDSSTRSTPTQVVTGSDRKGRRLA